MTRTMFLSFIILCFSLVVAAVTQMSIFPSQYTQTADSITMNTTTAQSISTQASVTSDSNTGYIGFFNAGIKVISILTSVVIGTLCVAIPLTNLGVPVAIAAMIQVALYVMFAFDQLTFWRGQPW
jgi:hypothetical protein